MAMGLPIVDRATIANQRILASLQYGAYSCEHQQRFVHDAENQIRGSIYGYSYGGYIHGAHLQAPMGGAGLRDTRRHMAIETAGMLERSLCRNGLAKQSILVYRTHAPTKRWPPDLQTALDGLRAPVTKRKKNIGTDAKAR